MAGDPLFDDVVLLLKFNEGVDGSTTTADLSNTPHTPVFGGAAALEVDNPAQGASHYRSTSGTGDRLDLGASTDWDFGAGDWCVEGFVATNEANLSYLVSNMRFAFNGTLQNGGWRIRMIAGVLDFQYTTTATGTVNSVAMNTGDIRNAMGTYVHVVLQRSGNTLSCWIDGTRTLNNTSFTDTIYASTDELWIGNTDRAGARDGMEADIDSFRITLAERYDPTLANIGVVDPDFGEVLGGIGDGNFAQSTAIGYSALYSETNPEARHSTVMKTTLFTEAPDARHTSVLYTVLRSVDQLVQPRADTHIIHGKEPTADGSFEALVPNPYT